MTSSKVQHGHSANTADSKHLHRENGAQPPNSRYDYVELKHLPSFTKLKNQVDEVVQRSSWWECYGSEWKIIIGALAVSPVALLLLREQSVLLQAAAVFILGCNHYIWVNKSGHLASHGGLVTSKFWNKFWTVVLVEFIGSFSEYVIYVEHVFGHHPHTNIINMGDSSTWKAPMVPCYPYMFLMPFVLPVLTPLVAISQLLGKWLQLLRFFIIAGAGISIHVWLLVYVSGFTISRAIVCLYLIRCVLTIPYIHINIFQHIGLPMYSDEKRPVRIYQMSTGCLNLTRNWFLDVTFGPALFGCHVEHHLFPKLSDSMCLKVQPLVRKYLLENGLPYNEDSYTSKLIEFINNYEELMVHAPPITHFVGLQ